MVIDRLLKIFEDGEEAEDVCLQSSAEFLLLYHPPATESQHELLWRMMDRLLKVFENPKELEEVRLASSRWLSDLSWRLPLVEDWRQ